MIRKWLENVPSMFQKQFPDLFVAEEPVVDLDEFYNCLIVVNSSVSAKRTTRGGDLDDRYMVLRPDQTCTLRARR